MTSIVAASLLSKVAQGTEAKKILDLEKDTRNYQDDKNRITSDWYVQTYSRLSLRPPLTIMIIGVSSRPAAMTR